MSLGNNGDLYIDRDTGDYYAKVDGGWILQGNLRGPQGVKGDKGDQGPQGLNGAPGAVVITADILFGAGAPDDADGSDTQVYVDQTTDDVYKKISGTWVLQTNLRGARGANVLSGTAAPADVLGFDGDSYIDTVSGLTYSKSSGTWTATGGSLKGPQGVQGPKGDKGDKGNTGDVGPKGDKGDTGTRGSLWFEASGVPGTVPGTAINDLYLNAANGDLYQLTSGGWVYLVTIKGVKGDKGDTGDTGPQGLQGVKGDKGDTGAAGAPGATGPKGDKGDTGATGAKGDKGDTGSPGTPGANGTNGVRGSFWYEGSGAPGTIAGQLINDLYLDIATGDVYKLGAVAWVNVGNITGPSGTNGADGATGATGATGARGSLWYEGSGLPGAITGQANNDLYLNVANGDVYQLTSGSWTLVGNIKGPTGAGGGGGSLDSNTATNIVLDRIYLSKTLAASFRVINAFADGFKGTDGIDASSSGYTADTANGAITAAAGSPVVVTPVAVNTTFTYTGNGGGAGANAAEANLYDGDDTTYAADPVSLQNTTKAAYDFGSAKNITSVRIITANRFGFTNAATFSIQYSDTSLTAGFTTADTIAVPAGTSQLVTKTITSVGAHRYWRIVYASGTTGGNAWLGELSFSAPSAGNYSLVTKFQTADASVDHGQVVVVFDNTAAPVMNTDLTAEITCNGGTNWTAVTLTRVTTHAQSGRAVAVSDDIATTAGTSFAARIKTHNSVVAPLYGVGIAVH